MSGAEAERAGGRGGRKQGDGFEGGGRRRKERKKERYACWRELRKPPGVDADSGAGQATRVAAQLCSFRTCVLLGSALHVRDGGSRTGVSTARRRRLLTSGKQGHTPAR